MKINYEKITKNTGITFTTENDVILYMQSLINYLYTHNKNYTKEQYYKLDDLKEILENIESEEI